MESRAMRRAMRSARALSHGSEILDFVKKTDTRKKLVAAAKSGVPPVTAISNELEQLIGRREAKLQPVKQFTGVCVRAVLEEEGFQVAEKGVRVSNDPIFRSGSTYESAFIAKKTSTLLNRFIQSLTDDEASEALKLLRKRRN